MQTWLGGFFPTGLLFHSVQFKEVRNKTINEVAGAHESSTIKNYRTQAQ